MRVDAGLSLLQPLDHIVLFHEHDDELLCAAGDYVSGAVRADEVAVVIATEPHRAALEASMAAAGVDVAGARARGTFIALDAAETLSLLLTGNAPEAGRFHAVVGELIGSAARTGRPVRAYGEMVALLWDAGDVSGAIGLEALWNGLGEELQFSLFCAYPLRPLGAHASRGAIEEVCRQHSAVVGIPASALEPSAVLPTGEAMQTFPKTEDAPRAARRFVVATLSGWGFVDVAGDAAIVVGEFAVNAVVHARSAFTVAVSTRSDAVRVSVADASGLPPLQRQSSLSAESGRGLAIVDALASTWGVELHGDSKAIWAEFRRARPAVPTSPLA